MTHPQNDPAKLPTAAMAKGQAKDLRNEMLAEGNPFSHSQALELISKQHGFRDSNTFLAAINKHQGESYSVGDRVSGQYLSQHFDATIRSCRSVRSGWFKLELDLDEAVDVVRFDSFSNLRKRIRGTVGPNGTSKEKTSDGHPHFIVAKL